MDRQEELVAELLALRAEYVEVAQRYAERMAALEAEISRTLKQATDHG